MYTIFVLSCFLISVFTTKLNSFAMLSELLLDLENFSMEISITTMKSVFVMTVAVIAVVIFKWSVYYMSSMYKQAIFFYSLLSFVISMMLLIISNSLLMVFIGWEGLGVTSFLLIVFYQNWHSAKGGLLTLLTNRLGDAVLLIIFCVWMGSPSMSTSLSSSLLFFLMMGSLVLTKSAQWPFSSWLPAAMAAPTPVSSLVHSSTLVTAGVWLSLRFMTPMTLNTMVAAILGTLTLSVASFSAMMEVDAKKIVALSTLSQLGLMFLTLAVSTNTLCFTHVITHAMAKANLFMIIGSLLHSSFSQQDARFLYTSAWSKFLYLSSALSLLSLVGWTFTSGFYSKEFILMSSSYTTINSHLSSLTLVCISSLTLAYCLKLFISLTSSVGSSNLSPTPQSMNQMTPIFLLSSGSITTGLMMTTNLTPSSMINGSIENFYPVILTFGLFVILISSMKNMKMFFMMGFLMQGKMIDLSIKMLFFLKPFSNMLEGSLSESKILITPPLLTNLFKLSSRILPILTTLGFMLAFL